MGSQSILLADEYSLVNLDHEAHLRSNGFDQLSIESLTSEKELARILPERRPDVLVLGDLFLHHPEPQWGKLSQLLTSEMEANPDMFVINLSSYDMGPALRDNYRMVTLNKPIDPDSLMRLVSDWFDRDDPVT